MSDLTHHKTKRERIRELILESNCSTDDIVNEVHTSKEYVYKERGKLKQEGLLVEGRSLSISDGRNNITVVKDLPDFEKYTDYPGQFRKGNSNNGLPNYEIPPLDKDGLMSMYNAFQQNKSPSHVIANLGIHPETSQKEYQRYLNLKSRDPFDLQNKIATNVTDPSPEIQVIIDKSATHLLTNDEILMLVRFTGIKNSQLQVKKALSDTAINLHQGLVRPVCRICHAPQPGVIFDRRFYFGNVANNVVSIAPCERCKSILDETHAQFNKKG